MIGENREREAHLALFVHFVSNQESLIHVSMTAINEYRDVDVAEKKRARRATIMSERDCLSSDDARSANWKA